MSDGERGDEPQRDPVGSTPPPTGEQPDRAAKGGRFLTRYAGLPEVGWGGGDVSSLAEIVERMEPDSR